MNYYDNSINMRNTGTVEGDFVFEKNVNISNGLNWDEIGKELEKLQNCKATLSTELKNAADKLADAAEKKDESTFKSVCKKIGQTALPLIQNLGLKLISSLMK